MHVFSMFYHIYVSIKNTQEFSKTNSVKFIVNYIGMLVGTCLIILIAYLKKNLVCGSVRRCLYKQWVLLCGTHKYEWNMKRSFAFNLRTICSNLGNECKNMVHVETMMLMMMMIIMGLERVIKWIKIESKI